MKTVKVVFILIAFLVLAFLLWALFFNDGGVLQSAYAAVADTLNGTWQKITGNASSKILPDWGGTVKGSGEGLKNSQGW